MEGRVTEIHDFGPDGPRGLRYDVVTYDDDESGGDILATAMVRTLPEARIVAINQSMRFGSEMDETVHDLRPSGKDKP